VPRLTGAQALSAYPQQAQRAAPDM
jgi:hypothetical protein